MPSNIETPEDYIATLAPERKKIIAKLRDTIKKNLPKGFEEIINYGMLGYVIPHKLYPKGYHADPKLPLPFMNLASQKNFIALYHMGIYADKEILAWFQNEYAKNCKTKLDMGKSCIRFKNLEDIPFALIGNLVKKIKAKDWIQLYEGQIKK